MTDTARPETARPEIARPEIARPGVEIRAVLTRRSIELPPDEKPLPPWPPLGEPAVTTPVDEATSEPPALESQPEPDPEPEPAPPPEPAPAPAERTLVVDERTNRGLLIFTAIMVALTVGVILGQAAAYKQNSVHAAPRAEYGTPAEPSPPAGQPGARITAPLGAARDRSFEVGGGAALISIRSVDLGDKLYDITSFDGSAVPRMAGESRLELVHTGAPGRIGADIQLNSAVRWKLRLAGGTAEQDIDMSGGRLAGIELTGGAERVVLRLPTPKGTIPIKLGGGVHEFDVQAAAPVRVRLGKGADDTLVGGKSRHAVKAGTILTAPGWKTATNRYDVTAVAKLNLARVSAAPRRPPSAPPPSGRSAPPTPSASTASTAGRPSGGRG